MTNWQKLIELADRYGYMMTDEDERSLLIIAHILKQTEGDEVVWQDDSQADGEADVHE